MATWLLKHKLFTLLDIKLEVDNDNESPNAPLQTTSKQKVWSGFTLIWKLFRSIVASKKLGK